MARKASIENNNKRKKLVKHFEVKRAALKEQANDKNASLNDRVVSAMKLAALPRNSSKVRVRNRCEQTGRPRGNLRKVGLSRNVFRELAGKGQLPGIIKSSW